MADKITVENASDDLQAIQLAIGVVVFQWSHIDSALDVLVSIALFLEGKKLRDPDRPVNLKKKIKHVRQAFDRILDLHPYRDEVFRLLDRISKQKDVRNDFAHSFLKSHKHDNGVFTFRKIEHSARDGFREWTFDVRDFESQARDLIRLQMDTVNFSYKIHEVFHQRLANLE